MKIIRLGILLLITVLFLVSCSYWPRDWSERQIREIVREELEVYNDQ